MRVLLVEDDKMIGDALLRALEQSGNAVDWFHDGASADHALRTQQYDMVLLDLGLPKLTGMEVLNNLRSRKVNTPVLILTARDAVADRITGLDSGADDYLVKPFSIDELEARMRALLRRNTDSRDTKLTCGDLTLDPAKKTLKLKAKDIPLSAREFQIIEVLMRRSGALVSRAEIENFLYGWNQEIDSNTVDVYIHKLRQKIGAKKIRTVRGLGFQVVDNT